MLLPDDAPVASAKAAPADGLGDADDEGNTNGRLWRTVLIGEQEHRIDMQIIRPYLRVITHGGQSAAGRKCGVTRSCCFPRWSELCQLLGATLSLQVTMAKAWMRSLSSPLVTCLTAAVQTITTSWKTSSCECATADIILQKLLYFNVSSLQLCGEQPGDARGRRLPDHLHEWGHSTE